jgi:hypothetical protein
MSGERRGNDNGANTLRGFKIEHDSFTISPAKTPEPGIIPR